MSSGVNIDPTVKDRQFCDVGSQYRTAIFFHDEAQKKRGGGVARRAGKEQAVQGARS